MEEFNIIPNGKRIFFKQCPPPRDTAIPLEHDYIFITEMLTHLTGSRITGGGEMSYTTFGIWGREDEGDKILKSYTFDLFTLSINIH